MPQDQDKMKDMVFNSMFAGGLFKGDSNNTDILDFGKKSATRGGGSGRKPSASKASIKPSIGKSQASVNS